MARASVRELKHLVRDVDRRGNVRFYVRVPGQQKIRIRAKPGTPEFVIEYLAGLKLLTPKIVPEVVPQVSGGPGSFRFVVDAYLTSAEFRSLDGSTQDWRRRALERVAEKHTDDPVDRITEQVVRHLRDEVRSQPNVANKRLAALRALFKWAVDEDLMTTNPARDVAKVRVVSKGHHSWSVEEVEKFEARHPVGSKARLALALLLYTAGRREDVVRFGPAHARKGRLVYTQAKNEHRDPHAMDVPIHPDLAALIAGTTTGMKTYLVNEYGKPFSPTSFSKAMRVWCDEAKLPHCSAHGVRKATASRLAESGASPHEIMAITGHKSIEEVERYTRAARMKGLATSAMGRL